MTTPSFKSGVHETADTKKSQEEPSRAPWIQTRLYSTQLSDDVKNHYGTHEDPYLVQFLQQDPEDPLNFSTGRKWAIAMFQAASFFAMTFSSSVYASGIQQVEETFDVSEEVAILGLALYVLGFAIGPILWAPMSEVYGRLLTFIVSYTVYMAFTVAAGFAPNITSLLVIRFFASAFGSSAQINPGSMIADLFITEERGPVMGVFAACPFLGPALGPIVGGFIAETVGWRWVLWVNAILSGVVYFAAMGVTVETYAPVILRTRAKALSRVTGRIYAPQFSAGLPPTTLLKELSISLTRPWVILVAEPIVMLSAVYISIIYATLYMFFAAIPIVFEETRHWSQGLAGLPFVGVAIGIMLAVAAAGIDNKSYVRQSKTAAAAGHVVEPEARLRNAMIGSIVLPIGLFLFAWTTYTSIPWIASVIGATLFSAGLVMVFISLLSYLVDAYTVYVASALAANTVLRSLFATAFPLFTTQMYANLGDQWASSIPAFLTIGCLPFPFMFYKYGQQIRSKCRFAAEAAEIEEKRRLHIEINSKGQSESAKEAV